MFEPVNYLAVFVAAIAHFVVGAVWYGALFGKKWLELLSPDEATMARMKAGQATAFIGSFVGSVLLAYAAARLIAMINPTSLVDGLILAALAWAGFALPFHLNDSFFEKKPWGLFWINTIYAWFGIEVVVVILYYWR